MKKATTARHYYSHDGARIVENNVVIGGCIVHISRSVPGVGFNSAWHRGRDSTFFKRAVIEFLSSLVPDCHTTAGSDMSMGPLENAWMQHKGSSCVCEVDEDTTRALLPLGCSSAGVVAGRGSPDRPPDGLTADSPPNQQQGQRQEAQTQAQGCARDAGGGGGKPRAQRKTKAVQRRVSQRRLGHLAFFHYLKRVESRTGFWEKHTTQHLLLHKNDEVKGHKDKHFKTPIGLAEIKPCHKKKHYDPDDSESDKSDDAIEQLNKENSRKSRPPMGAAGGDGAAAGLGQSRSWSVRAAVERVQAKVTPGNAPLARPGARKTKRDVSGVNGDDGDDDEEGSVTEKETDEESPVAGDSDTQSEGAVAKGPAAVNGRPTDDEAHVDIARVRKGSLVAEKAVAAAAAAVEPPPVLPSPCKDFSAKSQDKGPPSCTNSQGAEGGEDKREADTKKRATEGKDPKEDSKKSKVDDVKVAPVVTQTKELKIKSKASPGEAPSKTPSEAQKKSPSKATLGDGPSLPTGGAPSKGPSDGRSKPTGKGLRETESKDSSETQVGTVQAESEETPNSEASDDVIDDCPPPPAPFEHRMVVPQSEAVSTSYSIKQKDVLGGGRFGRVHKCVERTSGMTLAAKVIKAKGVKEKDEVNNEISIMNQLKHNNLLQLYDAYESKNDFVLIMEYIHGGELFDRIVSEDYNLTELDAIIFIRQICEGIHYMHQQYILHLDLKPENILCVNRKGNQIKIIDFGLARRYKPREKLKVHFGTPEFLAPEVVNYDYVSFPTDMWSLGVIAYMLLSGLSPFMGEDDNETLTNIVNVNWDFDDEAFENVSEEAKDFISRLLIKEKSGRMSASQCLKHNWLVNLSERAKKCKVRLKSQLLLHTYMVRRMWKKNFFAVTAANRLRKISSSTSLALEGSEK
uniref:Myosin light chain kinase 2, skeletal/cardiac muscle-like isoform X3 n=1 Tax=Petromyzon marinus TaxID=7757 RepID=A0AAJ7TGW9_PETMA|nr:myosin light chain kinase 2, skeletal/cardiac muscle-like isoform X3 [Petromyzon marinus]